jgi:hypothetical protein
MTWHLKDRELEKKLIAIDPDFIKTLTNTVEENLKLTNGWFNDESVTDVEITYNGEKLGVVGFYTDTLEEVPEYNPNAWNDSRKVTPPQNTIFRAKVYLSGLGEETIVEYDCLIYQYCSWYRVRDCKPFGGRLNITKDDHVEFRPWED